MQIIKQCSFKLSKLLAGVVLGGACLVVTGCGPSQPMMFGVPESEYKHMSRAQQNETIRAYNARKAQEKQDETTWNVLGGIASALHTEEKIGGSHSSSCRNTGPGSRECHSSSSSMSVGFG